MKQIQNTIIILLCICIIGFFANFAQNDYGLLIVGLSLLFIGFLYFLSAYNSIKQLKPQRFLMIYSIGCFIAITFIMRIINAEAIAIFILLSLIFIPSLIIPFYTKFKERNQSKKSIQIDYFESVFIAFMCLGYYMKLNHQTGATIVLTSSAFIAIPYTFRFIKLLKSAIRNKIFLDLINAILFLFLLLDMVALVFGRLHLKGVKQIAYLALVLLSLLIITLFIEIIRKKTLQFWWTSIKFNQRVFLIAFSILSVRWILSVYNLAPNVYSNEYPKDFQYLIENANSISTEGIKYGNRAAVYEDFYLKFIENQKGNK